MVVIVIIAILLSLLLPAISRVRARARVGQVRSEISVIDSAIASFRADFGIEPPGSIRLFGTPAGWNTTGATATDEAIRIRSRAYIRQLWPQFDFNSTAGGLTTLTPAAPAVMDLNGAECLVFFLGGMTRSATDPTPIGFSKDPSQPLTRGGVNRVKPYFDFVTTRLVNKDGDGFSEYVDPIPSQTSPYLYFDSNDGRAYQTFALSGDWCNVDNYQDGYAQASSFATGTWANGNWMKFAYYSAFANTGNSSSDISLDEVCLLQCICEYWQSLQ
jgi:type II secretory pathway pseudopilin PulG